MPHKGLGLPFHRLKSGGELDEGRLPSDCGRSSVSLDSILSSAREPVDASGVSAWGGGDSGEMDPERRIRKADGGPMVVGFFPRPLSLRAYQFLELASCSRLSSTTETRFLMDAVSSLCLLSGL